MLIPKEHMLLPSAETFYLERLYGASMHLSIIHCNFCNYSKSHEVHSQLLCKTENQKYIRKGIKIVCPGSAELCYHVEADESFYYREMIEVM